MDFKSIEEIKEYYGITSDHWEEIRKELKNEIANVHPDKTGGVFSNKKQQKEYEDLNSAINFIDGIDRRVVISKKEWDLVLKKIDDLGSVKSKEQISIENESVKTLNESINISIITFHKDNYFIKLSSSIIAGLLTILWTFPSIAENHKILKELVNYNNQIFTCLWIGSLVITCLTWIYIKNNERKEELLKKSYNLDSTQNTIFKLFTIWIRVASPKSTIYDHMDHVHTTFFTKADLMSFIFNYYPNYYRRFNNLIGLSQHDAYAEISKQYKEDESLQIPQTNKNLLKLFFKTPGEIDIDLSLRISDAIIDKLLIKDIIAPSDKKTLIDTYKYNYSFLD